MQPLEHVQKRIAEVEAEKGRLLRQIVDKYNLDPADYMDLDPFFDDPEYDTTFVENLIHEEDFELEWNDSRDLCYLYDMIGCWKSLRDILAQCDASDEKILRYNKKVFEMLVEAANSIKKERAEDIQKAQRAIAAMDEILAVCDTWDNNENRNGMSEGDIDGEA